MNKLDAKHIELLQRFAKNTAEDGHCSIATSPDSRWDREEHLLLTQWRNDPPLGYKVSLLKCYDQVYDWAIVKVAEPTLSNKGVTVSYDGKLYKGEPIPSSETSGHLCCFIGNQWYKLNEAKTLISTAIQSS